MHSYVSIYMQNSLSNYTDAINKYITAVSYLLRKLTCSALVQLCFSINLSLLLPLLLPLEVLAPSPSLSTEEASLVSLSLVSITIYTNNNKTHVLLYSK